MKFIHIIWVDASYQHGPVSIDELWPEIRLESTGCVIQETKDIISIAQDYDPHGKTWRYVQHIPKKMIIKKKYLK